MVDLCVIVEFEKVSWILGRVRYKSYVLGSDIALLGKKRFEM